MSTIKSSSEHLTLNADGSGKEIKFQSNATEIASISSAGLFTATSFSGSGASLTDVGGDLSFGGDTFGADKTIGSNDNYALSLETNATERLKLTNDGRGLSQFTAKAWVNFNGTGTVGIEDDHNVSSVIDNGTGIYTANFTNAMANSDYSASLTGGMKSGGAYSLAYNGNVYSTTAIKVRSYYEDIGGYDIDTGSIVIFGD